MNWNITFISKLYKQLKMDNMTGLYGAPQAYILSEILINEVEFINMNSFHQLWEINHSEQSSTAAYHKAYHK